VYDDDEIENVIASLERESGSGLVVMPDGFMLSHRAAIISLTARGKVPTVYSLPLFAKDGGLLSYGPEIGDIFRRAAAYVDRILRGADPADLPVQLPVKFEMIVNAKTAKALGLAIPPGVLAIADEVIE
jgi:putative tryptophan/tyrosine transport system substrate-binding protein